MHEKGDDLHKCVQAKMDSCILKQLPTPDLGIECHNIEIPELRRHYH